MPVAAGTTRLPAKFEMRIAEWGYEAEKMPLWLCVFVVNFAVPALTADAYIRYPVSSLHSGFWYQCVIMSTYFPSGKGLADGRKWLVVDAKGKTVGRLATEVARILSGKNNPAWTPFMDM